MRMRARALVIEVGNCCRDSLEGIRNSLSGIIPRSRSKSNDYEKEISLVEEKLGTNDLTLSSMRLDNIDELVFLVGCDLITLMRFRFIIEQL